MFTKKYIVLSFLFIFKVFASSDICSSQTIESDVDDHVENACFCMFSSDANNYGRCLNIADEFDINTVDKGNEILTCNRGQMSNDHKVACLTRALTNFANNHAEISQLPADEEGFNTACEYAFMNSGSGIIEDSNAKIAYCLDLTSNFEITPDKILRCSDRRDRRLNTNSRDVDNNRTTRRSSRYGPYTGRSSGGMRSRMLNDPTLTCMRHFIQPQVEDLESEYLNCRSRGLRMTLRLCKGIGDNYFEKRAIFQYSHDTSDIF